MNLDNVGGNYKKMEKEQKMVKKEVVAESDEELDGVEEEEEKKKKGVMGGVGGGGGLGKKGGNGLRCCQADKCTANLSDAKQYHRRHKVCEFHAKAQVVLVGGIRQRFCQQCSRL